MLHCWAVCFVDFLGLWNKSYHLRISNWSSTGAFPFTHGVKPHWTTYTTCRWTVLLKVPDQTRAVMADFNAWYQSRDLTFCTWDAIFHEWSVGTDGGKTRITLSKLYRVTSLNTFSFYFCAFQFMSNIIQGYSKWLLGF